MNADEAGTFKIGGDIEVNRLGFGAMRIVGEGVWGPCLPDQLGAAGAAAAITLSDEEVARLDSAAEIAPKS